MNAVTYHCKNDTDCPDKNLLWKLLKDADSLDRGRFGAPWISKGCNVRDLRLDIFNNNPKLKECLAWLAHWLVSITRYTRWSEDTFMDLKNEIMKSLKASLENQILDETERSIAFRMLVLLERS